jgi:hypothetical protein
MYIKVSEYDAPVTTDAITKKDLVSLRDRSLTAIINTDEDTYFDAENNEWLPMQQV